jgi:hypothetical protein
MGEVLTVFEKRVPGEILEPRGDEYGDDLVKEELNNLLISIGAFPCVFQIT